MDVLLAKTWAGQDITDWWMSEKLDGVRAVWDGNEFFSRNGNHFVAPDWFRKLMPGTALDGELFIGRGQFQKTVSIVRTQGEDKGWNRIVFHAFDLYPLDALTASLKFEGRQALVGMAARGSDVVRHVEQHRCQGADHVNAFVDRIVAAGGEGAMLREPGSLYEKKRSGTLLKVKRFHDVEATVLAYVPGKGKHKGRLGAMTCTLPNGIAFEVGTGFSDAQREAPPKIGKLVTVRYQELTDDGVPRFPVFVGARDYE
jgi:DNA ligase 1